MGRGKCFQGLGVVMEEEDKIGFRDWGISSKE